MLLLWLPRTYHGLRSWWNYTHIKKYNMLDLIKITSEKVINPGPDALGINVEKPKFPNYALVSKRLESYQNWPVYIPIDKNNLVEAGLVYTVDAMMSSVWNHSKNRESSLYKCVCKYEVWMRYMNQSIGEKLCLHQTYLYRVGDSVRCYFCGGGLRKWEVGVVPMEEHARWYPKCPHIILVKGQTYVDKINRGEQPEETDVGKDQASGGDMDCINSVAAESCLEMGFSKDMVERAINVFKRKPGNKDITAKQLCVILFELEESGPSTETKSKKEKSSGVEEEEEQSEETECLESLLEENRRLKENQMCKICMDGQADVIFLPCGHMVTCGQCAPAFTKCPYCRKDVSGLIKTF